MAAMELETGKVDEALYSRQLYVLGREGQSKMASSTVLVCGLTGTGAGASRPAAQRIMTRRELHKFLVAGNTVYVCIGWSARRQRRGCTDACTCSIARRSAPKGSPLVSQRAALVARRKLTKTIELAAGLEHDAWLSAITIAPSSPLAR